MNRPNILIFMPDQLRADAVGCFGNPVAITPNIDALALRGTRFNNAWANHPVCGPSRVNLMTGWYPHTAGHRTLTNLLTPNDPNLLAYLKDGGYHVSWTGARGDVFAPGVTERSTHFCGWTTKPDTYSMGPQYPEGSALYDAFYHGVRSGNENWLDFDEATTQTAVDWLNTDPTGPWCLWVPLMFPHLPFEVEEPWYNMFNPADMPPRIADFGHGKPSLHQAIRQKLGTERLTESEWQEIQRVYYAMVTRVDDQLGRVMTALGDAADNTVVIFLTDHGEYLGDFGLIEKYPSGLDRCLLQNPLIMAGPDIQIGHTSEAMVEMVDILPTVLEIAGIKSTHTHFGQSLVPVLNGKQSKHRAFACSEGGFTLPEVDLLETAKGEYAKKAALQHEAPETVGKAFSIRNHAFTYVYRHYESDELYDRAVDPRETNNLINEPTFEAAAGEMKAQLFHWLVETADQIPWTPHPRFPRVPHGQHEEFSAS